MSKPKVAVFSFTGCEGCSLEILNCEDEIPAILAAVDFVNFREAMSERSDDYDIAFIDGAITTPDNVEEIKFIREHAKVLVPIGACATTGGLNVMKNYKGLEYCKKKVYGDKADVFETIDARPVEAVVPVDLKIYGCPPPKAEILEVIKAVLAGRTPRIPNYPVCVECKRKGNVCEWVKGNTCMGVVARAGCDAICPSYGKACVACRGLIDDPNNDAYKEIMEEHGVSAEQVLQEYRLYNGYYDVAKG